MSNRTLIMPLLRRLRKDEGGQILVYFTVMLPAIMGLIGLALEGGALLHLHSDLQELADAAALAGAKDLDGSNAAITNAINDAETLLSNDPKWSNVAKSGVQINTPTFCSAYTASTNTCTVTTTSSNASYIQVTTINRSLIPSFLIVAGAISTASTNASAVAGTSYVACNVQPLMLCNPWEQDPTDTVFGDHVTAGMMFQFASTGSTGGYSPGDFGLVDPSGGTGNSGAKAIKELLSQSNPNFCFVNNVTPSPGQKSNDVNDGLNVRFDIPPSGNDPLLDQTPAPNVVKGFAYTNSSCNKQVTPAGTSADPTDVALPRDANLSMNKVGSAYIGNGVMTTTDKNTYWQWHHGANWPTGVSTRYDAYLLEQGLGSNGTGTRTPPAWVNTTKSSKPYYEPNAPYCSSLAAGDFTRRTISVAVINCIANNVQGKSATNLLSNTYADFFLTEPANMPGAIYAEFIRSFTPQSDGTKLHQVVQLYR